MNPSHGYSEGAEVPEDKTPRRMSKDEEWLLYVGNARKESWNQAIDACISYMKENPIGLDAIDEQYIEEFESLKNKPI